MRSVTRRRVFGLAIGGFAVSPALGSDLLPHTQADTELESAALAYCRARDAAEDCCRRFGAAGCGAAELAVLDAEADRARARLESAMRRAGRDHVVASGWVVGRVGSAGVDVDSPGFDADPTDRPGFARIRLG